MGLLILVLAVETLALVAAILLLVRYLVRVDAKLYDRLLLGPKAFSEYEQEVSELREQVDFLSRKASEKELFHMEQERQERQRRGIPEDRETDEGDLEP